MNCPCSRRATNYCSLPKLNSFALIKPRTWSLLKTLVPSGETRDIHRVGGRYLTLVGSNLLFDLPEDRWRHAIETDAVTGIATAAAALVVKLTR